MSGRYYCCNDKRCDAWRIIIITDIITTHDASSRQTSATFTLIAQEISFTLKQRMFTDRISKGDV